jgi:hypothetical protein
MHRRSMSGWDSRDRRRGAPFLTPQSPVVDGRKVGIGLNIDFCTQRHLRPQRRSRARSAGGCGAVLGVGAGEGLCAETAVRATTAVAAIARIVPVRRRRTISDPDARRSLVCFRTGDDRDNCHLPGFSSHTCRTHTPRTVSGPVPRGVAIVNRTRAFAGIDG